MNDSIFVVYGMGVIPAIIVFSAFFNTVGVFGIDYGLVGFMALVAGVFWPFVTGIMACAYVCTQIGRVGARIGKRFA